MMCIYCGVESVTSENGVCPNCGRKNEQNKEPRDEVYVQSKPQSRLLDRISDFLAGKM